MVNAQQWLDAKYAKEKRKEVKEIYLNEQLEGKIDLRDFTKLEKISVSHFVIKGNFEMVNKKKEVKIVQLKNSQQYLDQRYPVNQNNPTKKRNKIKELNIIDKELEGTLDLTDFVNLEKLYCYDNKLVSLKVNNLDKLKTIICSNNQLTNLEINGLNNLEYLDCKMNHLTDINSLLSKINYEKLNVLYLTNNNFSESDLTPLSKFTNLEYLGISSSYNQQDNDNIFYKSLKVLQTLTKLEELYIKNTSSVKDIHYSNNKKTGLGVTSQIKQLLSSLKEDWTNIHPDFTPQLQKRWEERNFDYYVAKWWVKRGLSPDEADFASYLDKNPDYDKFTTKVDEDVVKKLRKQWIISSLVDGLLLNQEDRERFSNQERDIDLMEVENVPKLSFEIIEQIKDFEHSGAYGWWKPLTPYQESLVEQLITNKGLIGRYKKNGLCSECHQPKSNYNWCQFCNAQHLQKEFDKWTSGSPVVDECIKQHQLKAVDHSQIIEWIPYDRLEVEKDEKGDIKILVEGGFGKVYKAKWLDGEIDSWHTEKKRWWRGSDFKEDYLSLNVVLKSLNNSQNITKSFLQEVIFYKTVNYRLNVLSHTIRCYGISQDPVTKDYLIVMQYKEEGNLRKYLQNNHSKLTFENKLAKLDTIALGLASIHKWGLVHCDFHPGNILSEGEHGYITDLGLCRPVNETDDSKVYGVLPYVAPEVLRGCKHAHTTDIYSFGMVMYEVFSGIPPYYNIVYGKDLALLICNGFRPNLNNVPVPQLLKNLISRCWDADPLNRPTSSVLQNALNRFSRIVSNKSDDIFYEQYQELQKLGMFDQEGKLTSSTIPILNFPTVRSQAIYTSCLLDFPNLPIPQNNPSQEWQTTTLLELQIKGVEKELEIIKKPLNDEQISLLESFIEFNKKLLKNRNDGEARNKVNELDEKLLEDEILSEEEVKKILICCEKLVELEQKTEKELENKIEIPSK